LRQRILLIIFLLLPIVANAVSDKRQMKQADKQQTNPLAGRGGGWFLGVHDLLLRNQLANCENYKNAGNSDMYRNCKNRIMNAHDFLTDRANVSILPVAGWSFCSNNIQSNFPLGAQCLTAVELLCPLNKENEFTDINSCLRLMESNAWLSNPIIQRLNFTNPNR